MNQSERDGFHPNLLTGYLTALAVRTGMTGEDPVGQPWDFVSELKSPAEFLRERYGYGGSTSNFPEILKSPEDMRALQALVGKYSLPRDAVSE